MCTKNEKKPYKVGGKGSLLTDYYRWNCCICVPIQCRALLTAKHRYTNRHRTRTSLSNDHKPSFDLKGVVGIRLGRSSSRFVRKRQAVPSSIAREGDRASARTNKKTGDIV